MVKAAKLVLFVYKKYVYITSCDYFRLCIKNLIDVSTGITVPFRLIDCPDFVQPTKKIVALIRLLSVALQK
jgi:hypothetical protein